MQDYVGLFIFTMVAIYGFSVGNAVKKKASLWAAFLLRSVLFISAAFLNVFALNVLGAAGEIDYDVYMSNYPYSYLLALWGCSYLLPVMQGKGKNRRKISKDAFK